MECAFELKSGRRSYSGQEIPIVKILKRAPFISEGVVYLWIANHEKKSVFSYMDRLGYKPVETERPGIWGF